MGMRVALSTLILAAWIRQVVVFMPILISFTVLLMAYPPSP